MALRVFRWTAFLATTAIAVALWNRAAPSDPNGGWHGGFLTAAIVASVAAFGLGVWAVVESMRTKGAHEGDPAQPPARIQATDSSKWSIRRSVFAGGRPAIKAESSPGWTIEDSVFDGEDEPDG